MAGAQPGAGIAVEVFVEEQVVTPLWIVLKMLFSAKGSPEPAVIA
jgi:hypothetical protein